MKASVSDRLWEAADIATPPEAAEPKPGKGDRYKQPMWVEVSFVSCDAA